MVLPQTSGVHLFCLLKPSAPDLKAILISGYAAAMLGSHNPLHPEAAFIEQPLGKDSLLSTVRTVLDEQAAG